MREFTKNCPGAKVIKQAPRDALVLDLSVMGEDTFNNVFKEATHVQMCINVDSTNIKKLHMPKLKRMFPCKKQWHSLNITNNPDLKSVVLGDPNDDEKFVINMKVQQNPRLSDKNMRDLNNICRNKNLGTCTIDRDGEEAVVQKTTTQGKPEGQPGGFDERNSFTSKGESPPNSDDRRKTKRTLPPVLNGKMKKTKMRTTTEEGGSVASILL
ncbi:hypothetical protein ANCCAN_12258 [Ancylostoma caninum]|uniref:Receptor L domain protein n=1 Tax=Ancylostoma caninum TaxID=29170 RepID=A0A368GBN0_ANCCA|nr:hypothetical protein ANCCAN_12258 [Ancylostoma caninum]